MLDCEIYFILMKDTVRIKGIIIVSSIMTLKIIATLYCTLGLDNRAEPFRNMSSLQFHNHSVGKEIFVISLF